MKNSDIVIVAAKRTPIGALLGQFSTVSAPRLGSIAIKGVLPAALGQAPARQAALAAGMDINTACTTVNKVCGSGMKSLMLAHDALVAESAHVVVAGGMESMSNAPYLLSKARQGLRFGHGELLDHMLYDGLQNAYDGASMGVFAERCADRFQFTRAAQDQYAAESVQRALY
ncbi:MAG: acetyl-CoA C-acetyltransferase, partial [Halothiobacillaceae bacterium]